MRSVERRQNRPFAVAHAPQVSLRRVVPGNHAGRHADAMAMVGRGTGGRGVWEVPSLDGAGGAPV